MGRIRLGIVGTGLMGRRLAVAAQETMLFSVAAAADHDVARAERVARELGAVPYPSLERMLEECTLDAIYVGLPHSLHAQACATALRHGIHVLVDKPLCTTWDDAQIILDAAATSSAICMVGFSYRFRAEWVRAAELVRAGAIGTRLAASDAIFDALPATPAWYWDQQGGGVMHLQGHHAFDRLAWMIGRAPDRVAARVDRDAEGVDRAASVLLSYGTAATATVSLGFGLGYEGGALGTSFVIQGERGVIEISPRDGLRMTTASGDVESMAASGDWPVQQMRRFAAAITDCEPFPGLADGTLALRAAVGALQAGESRKWVDLDA